MQVAKDIVILGGGIAGLWLLNRLRSAGYAAVLLEKSALGDGQTIASQGMIHGGLKYALSGALTGASEAIADMPAHWLRCLRGEGDVDLRGANLLLSDAYYMWPRNSVGSRMTAFLGSKLVSSKTTAVSAADVPAFFRGHLDGPLYRLHDIVLDVPALLKTLGERHRNSIYRTDYRCDRTADGSISTLHLPGDVQLTAKLFVCTAGEGNADLLATMQPANVAMQRRPLQMVFVKHHIAQPLYVHCVADFSATPDLTITTHPCKDGSYAWYLGGELAEAGAKLDKPTQIERAKQKLRGLFPWCDFSKAYFDSFYINRAEAQQPGGKRPDHESVLQAGNVLYCWPTKLTLAPALANSIMSRLDTLGLQAQQQDIPIAGFDYPGVATPAWDKP